MDARTSRYHEVYARWQRDPEGFWGEAAADDRLVRAGEEGVRPERRRLRPLVRRRRLQHLLQRGRPPCAERGRGSQPALIYDSPVTNTKRSHHLRGAARRGRRRSPRCCRISASSKGDRVILYMPMVPEAVFAMLACARIGAVHSVVFGGFAAKELATRIDDAKPKVILSASCGIEVDARRPLQAAARRGDRARHAQAARPASSCSARRPKRR